MNIACHYAIVRFLPFVETGEFANVGVVLFSPNARHFGMDRRLKSFDHGNALKLWDELIKPRETMLRFSEPRIVLAANVPAKLEALYQYYVERNFVNREYQEKVLVRGVRDWLRDANLQSLFAPARVGNDEYHAQFPFVEMKDQTPAKIIKPLNLVYGEAARIIDHGGQWVVRVNALKKRNLLPAQVLFAIDGPTDATPRGKARKEVVQELEDAGVIVTPYNDRQRVIAFARQP